MENSGLSSSGTQSNGGDNKTSDAVDGVSRINVSTGSSASIKPSPIKKDLDPVIAPVDDNKTSDFKPALSAPTTKPISVKTKQPKLWSSLLTVLLVVVVLGGIYGVYDWQHRQVASLNSQITSLNSQINGLNSKLTLNSSKSSSASSTQDYLYLYSYGVKIPLSNGIQDLYYVDTKAGNYDSLSFSSQSLTNVDPSCIATVNNYLYSEETPSGTDQTVTGPSPFDLITVSKGALPANEVGTLDTQLGTYLGNANNYYFYYVAPQAVGSCASNKTAAPLVTTQSSLLLSALKDVQPIN